MSLATKPQGGPTFSNPRSSGPQYPITQYPRTSVDHLCSANIASDDVYQAQIRRCDDTIEGQIRELEATYQPPDQSLGPDRSARRRSANEPRFEMRTPLYTLCAGVDLTALPGLGPYGARKLISEIGLDMGRWATEKHFVSWLLVAPRNQFSGGKLLSSRTQPSANRAATTLRLAAMSLGRRSCAGRLLSSSRRARRQGQGDHGHSPQARDPRLSHAPGSHALP